MRWRDWFVAFLSVMSCSRPSTPPTAPGPAIYSGVLWATGHETGDLSDWYKDEGGGAFNSGTGQVSVTTEAAHTGKYSAKLEVRGIDRDEQASRLFRWGENLTEGYFSAWYMFPVLPEVGGWLDIFEFKKKVSRVSTWGAIWDSTWEVRRDSTWGIRQGSTWEVRRDPTWGDKWGSIMTAIIDPTWYNEIKTFPQGVALTLTHWNEAWDVPGVGAASATPLIEAGKWFHVEWYYKDGIEDGMIKVWVNGEMIWDLKGVNTRGVDPHIQWAPCLYGANVNPGHLVLYVDDAVISARRVGPWGILV